MRGHTLPLFSLDEFDVPKFSFSQLSLFKQCKLRYFKKYVSKELRQDQKPTKYLSIGRTAHLVLASLYRDNSFISKEIVTRILRQNWISDGFSSRIEEDNEQEKLEKQIWNLVEKFPPDGETLHVEASFEDRFDDFILTTRIDRVEKLPDGTCRLIDYKVGDKGASFEGISENFQWAIHCLAASKILREQKLTVSSIDFMFIQACKRISITPNEQKIEAQLNKIRSLIQEVKQEQNFDATVNKFCRDCKVYSACPAIEALRVRGIDPREEIVRLESFYREEF